MLHRSSSHLCRRARVAVLVGLAVTSAAIKADVVTDWDRIASDVLVANPTAHPATTALHLILGVPTDHWENARSTSIVIRGQWCCGLPTLRRLDRRPDFGGGHEVQVLGDHRSRTSSC